jgi:zinc/manganese transport system permease protein
VLVGVPALWGLVLVTLAAGIGMGLLGERLTGRDVAIGLVLAVSLGLGLLFLHFFTAYASQATALLFGNVLGVDTWTLWTLLGLGLLGLAGLAAISRPLLFASLQPELAEARGVSLRLIAVLFLAIVALATAECAQIVGVLLVFALMVGPSATAQRLTTRLGSGLLLSAALAVSEAWLGIALAWWTDWPTSFWITALSGSVYLLSCWSPGRSLRRLRLNSNAQDVRSLRD